MIDATGIYCICLLWITGTLMLLGFYAEGDAPANKREALKRVFLTVGWPIALVTYVPYLGIVAFFNYWKNLPD